MSALVSDRHGSAHDPLCPVAPGQMLVGVRICECDLIARVREDERLTADEEWLHGWPEARNIERAAALRDAVEAVKALRDDSWSLEDIDDAVAAIEALGGER